MQSKALNSRATPSIKQLNVITIGNNLMLIGMSGLLLLISGINGYMNIFGLLCVFMTIKKTAILIGIVIEAGKIISIITLHMRWASDSFLHRPYYLVAAMLLTSITFCDVFGFLYYSYNKSIEKIKLNETKLSTLTQQKHNVLSRIDEIEKTISSLPENHVTRRVKLREETGYNQLQIRLNELDRQLGDLNQQKITLVAHSGPILINARLIGLDERHASLIYILILSIVTEMISVGTLVAIINSIKIRIKRSHHQHASNSAIKKSSDSNSQLHKIDKKTAAGKNVQSSHSGNLRPVLPKTAKIKKPAGPRYTELIEICRKYQISPEMLKTITAREKLSTVNTWLTCKKLIPEKAFRQLQNWVHSQASSNGKMSDIIEFDSKKPPDKNGGKNSGISGNLPSENKPAGQKAINHQRLHV